MIPAHIVAGALVALAGADASVERRDAANAAYGVSDYQTYNRCLEDASRADARAYCDALFVCEQILSEHEHDQPTVSRWGSGNSLHPFDAAGPALTAARHDQVDAAAACVPPRRSATRKYLEVN